MLARWASGKSPLPGLQMAAYLLCLHMAKRGEDLMPLSLLIKTNLMGGGALPSCPHLNLITP